MNYGSSNAKVLDEKNYGSDCKAHICRADAKKHRDLVKQKLCGALLIASVIFAVTFAEDMAMALWFVPAGLYLIFTGKNILTF